MTRGYLIFAVSKTYHKLAATCAMTIKMTQPDGYNSVAVVTDDEAYFHDSPYFDHVITYHGMGGMSSRVMAYELTPYDNTVFLDSDILFTRRLDHYWDAMEKHELLFASDVTSYRGNKYTYGPYRKLFIEHGLPDIYTAWTFFKKTKTAKIVFDYARHVTEYSTDYAQFLGGQKFPNGIPTDEAMALVVTLLGLDRTVEGGHLCPTIVHLKPGVQEWTSKPFYATDAVRIQVLKNMIAVGTYGQVNLLHFVDKGLITDEFVEHLKEVMHE